MFFAFNGQEHTIGHLVNLLDSSWWRIVKVYHLEGIGSFAQQIEAVPV
jgi:hypothetical protein